MIDYERIEREAQINSFIAHLPKENNGKAELCRCILLEDDETAIVYFYVAGWPNRLKKDLHYKDLDDLRQQLSQLHDNPPKDMYPIEPPKL